MMWIRRTLLVLFALIFLLPAIGLLSEALSAPDLSAEEPMAMLVGSFFLGLVGVILLWISWDMGRKARAGKKLTSNTDATAVGLSALMASKDLNDDFIDGGDS